MGRTIEEDLPLYRAATADDIRLRSGGSVKRRVRHGENRGEWRDMEGTIWDQRIFGPAKDWECACGKFKGEINKGTVCDLCKVKVMPSSIRKIRCGHINLSLRIPHPLVAGVETLDAVPIVPAHFWASAHGQPLAEAYEEVIRASLAIGTVEAVVAAYGGVLAHLRQLYETYSEFDPELAERLAFGMALKKREAGETEEVAPETAAAETAPTEAEDGEEPPDWDHLKLAPMD